jgi:phospholipase D1/2
VKRAHQVFILHFALKKRAFIEEIHEKQEQVSKAIYTEFHLIAYI